MQLDLGAPRPAHGLGEPAIAGASAILDRKAPRYATFIAAGAGLRFGDHFEIEKLLLLAAKQRQEYGAREAWSAARKIRNNPRTSRPKTSLPSRTFDFRAPCDQNASRNAPIRSASSAKRSTKTARAPSSAASTVATFLSALTKGAARVFGSCSGVESSASASGANPLSMAICALVRRLGLNGR